MVPNVGQHEGITELGCYFELTRSICNGSPERMFNLNINIRKRGKVGRVHNNTRNQLLTIGRKAKGQAERGDNK